MTTIIAEVTRGVLVESMHHGVVVAVHANGRIAGSAGDPSIKAYFRSSAKPFQAIPVVESGAADRFGFDDAELALCCSSHNAAPWQQDLVRGMLDKVGQDASALRCGIAPPYDEDEAARIKAGLVPPSPVQCDCSGKHTGMLAVCLQQGWPIESYLDPEHPLQQWIFELIAAALRRPPEEIAVAPDGCSVPTFGAPLHAFAVAFAALAAPEQSPLADHSAAIHRLLGAIAAHPEHIAGPGALDTDLVEVTTGRLLAKLGAEGLVCIAAPERDLGLAIRILDGSERARGAVAIAALEQLGLLSGAELNEMRRRQQSPVSNFNGWEVGELRAVFSLAAPQRNLS